LHRAITTSQEPEALAGRGFTEEAENLLWLVKLRIEDPAEAASLLKRKLPQTRDGYAPNPSMRDAAE